MHSAAGQERLRQKANLTALGTKRGIGWVGWVEIEIRCERKLSKYVGPCRCNMFRIDPYLWVSMCVSILLPIGSMYGIYGNIYHQYTPNVSIYTIHGSYGL